MFQSFLTVVFAVSSPGSTSDTTIDDDEIPSIMMNLNTRTEINLTNHKDNDESYVWYHKHQEMSQNFFALNINLPLIISYQYVPVILYSIVSEIQIHLSIKVLSLLMYDDKSQVS